MVMEVDDNYGKDAPEVSKLIKEIFGSSSSNSESGPIQDTDDDWSRVVFLRCLRVNTLISDFS